MKPSLAALAAAFLAVVPVSPETVRFRHLSLAEGLSQSTVNAIVQDRRGFLWLGTRDGLNRYDGYAFTALRHVPDDPESLSDNVVTALHEDAAGVLWVGTREGGLNRYDPVRESFQVYRAGPEPRILTAIAEDAGGVLWIGTSDGLYRFDSGGEAFRRASGGRFGDVVVDRGGTLWASVLGGGLYRFDRERGRLVPFRTERALRQVAVIYEPPDEAGEALWLGTGNGELLRLDRRQDSWRAYPELTKDGGVGPVNDLLLDPAGDFWVASFFGLHRLERATGRLESFRRVPGVPHSLGADQVRSLYVSSQELLWVGSAGGGASVFDRYQSIFTHYRAVPPEAEVLGLGNDQVRTAFEDRAGELWVGSAGGGLDRFNAERTEVTHHRHDDEDPASLANDQVWWVYEDREGELWVATMGGGLDRFDRATGRFHHHRANASDPAALVSGGVQVLREDKDGALWIGTVGGLHRFDRHSGRAERFLHDPGDPESLAGVSVLALWIDRRDRLWAGTETGLSRLDDLRRGPPFSEAAFRRYGHEPSDPSSLTSNHVRSLYEDRHGVVWVGTKEGLHAYLEESGGFRRFSVANGLPNDVIWAIVEDAEGFLWVSTNRGLARFARAAGVPDELPRVDVYGPRDGLLDYEYNTGAAFRSSRGELFFGGISGLTVFDPRELREEPAPPPVVVTGFEAFGEESRVLPRDAEIVLRHAAARSFSFEYVALNYRNSERNRYRFQLDGFDAGRVDAGPRRWASYTNLDPGSYVFRVAASTGGAWSEPAAVRLRIRPPWWRTRWALGLFAACALGLAFLVHRVLLVRERQRTRVREAELRAQAAEAEARAIAAENERQTAELEGARQLQLSLLPRELPSVEGLEVAVHMSTASEVGGDYYDFAVLDGALRVVLGDATGHGLRSGTVVAAVKALLSADEGRLPFVDFFRRATATFRRMRLGRLHMALVLLRFERAGGGCRLRVAAAGMPPVYVWREKERRVEEVLIKGAPLGAFVDYPYDSRDLELREGDTVLVLSDGLPELLDESEEVFGYPRVAEAFAGLLSEGHRPPEQIVEGLRMVGESFRAARPAEDDMTFVVVRVGEEES